MTRFRSEPLLVKRTATFSPCRRYRYTLDIVWDDTRPMAVFIGLNPSTADETQDDPTIRRCRGFAESWGCGGMRMLNLFAFRATDPKVMKGEADPIEHDKYLNWIDELAFGFHPVVACWGTHGSHLGRGADVSEYFNHLQCLGKNADGSPKHPLYLKSDTKLEPYA